MSKARELSVVPNQYSNFKNRIINGDMRIDQRNAGASVSTPTAGNWTYFLDRWAYFCTSSGKYSVQQNAGSVTPPNGFTNYLGVTSLAATTVGSGDVYDIKQAIEGFNVADLGWGTANAQPVTLSFWVRSSLTGAFGGSFSNADFNRLYPFSYTINAANTWEQKTITVSGDTTGSWLKTNGIGVNVVFGLGVGSTYQGTANVWGSSGIVPTGSTSVVGTNGATFYITGVQLEKGSTATSFDYRPYGTELALCQRYFQTTYNTGTAVGTATQVGAVSNQAQAASTYINLNYVYQVKMRTTPTITAYSTNSGASGKLYSNAPAGDITSVASGFIGDSCALVTAGAVSLSATAYLAAQFTASAEL